MYRLAVNSYAMASNNRQSYPGSSRSSPSYQDDQYRASSGCGFCRRNRESSSVIHGHRLKDDQGRVTCPHLRRYICPGCGATGDEAHTRSYCPNIVRARQQYEQRDAPSSSQESGAGRSGRRAPSPRYGTRSQPTTSSSISRLSTSAGSTRSAPRPSSGSSLYSTRSQHQREQEHSMIQMARMGANGQARLLAAAAARASVANRLTQTTSSGTPPTPAESQDDGEEQNEEEEESDEDDEREIAIELGANRSFYNMSRVTNSRYNSAGQLRNRRGGSGRWINNAAQASSQHGHGRGGHRW